jgi:hypothetical protein
LFHRKSLGSGQISDSGNHSLIRSPSQPPEQQWPSIPSHRDSGGIQGPRHKISPSMCLEAPVLREGVMGQWVTQAPPRQPGPGNTSSLAQTSALDPPLPQKHPGQAGYHLFKSLYGPLFLTNDLILDSETARLTSHITQLAQFQQILSYTKASLMTPLLLLHPFVLVIWCSLKLLTYPESLQSPYESGHILCFFPSQQESEWLDCNLGSTSPESSARTPQDSSPQDSDSDEAQYSCKPLEDFQLLFEKAPQGK